MKKICLSFLFLSSFSNLFPLFDLAVDGGYANSSLTRSYASAKLEGSGYILSFAGHVNFSIPTLIKLGVGPTFAYGNQNLELVNVTNTNSQDTIRYGAEVYAQLEILSVIKPFVKLGAGREILRNTSTTQAGDIITKSEYGNLYYNLFGGINIPVFSLLSIYIQGGPTIGTWADLKTTSQTFNGVPQTVINNSNYQAYSSGYILSAGVNLSF